MNTLTTERQVARIKHVIVTEDTITVDLADGRHGRGAFGVVSSAFAWRNGRANEMALDR